MTDLILAIDQGTTSSRALLLDAGQKVVAVAQREFPQHFPRPGEVEHDPEDLWETTLATCREVIADAQRDGRRIAAIGITNQRETTLVWERSTGRPIHRAIVWQDRRTSDACRTLKDGGHEAEVTARTGLLLDPYFSATKIAWLLDNVTGARAAAERGELAFGTVDTFLLWRLTGGKVHATDATNASRTLLYDIARGDWDDHLLEMFRVPRSLLPQVRDSSGDFGVTDASLLGEAIAVRGIAGDQQAAAIGQACFKPGMMKSTYGTGCFAILNTGAELVRSQNRLLTTVAYQLGGRRTYALEGAIFVAGAAVQWLRDGLGIIASAAETEGLAAAADPHSEVVLVPAFVGLGAPYWEPDVRGALFGLTRGAGRAELARATLESVAYQTRDLIEAMHQDWPGLGAAETVLRVDGGMVASNWTMQFLADMLAAPVERPAVLETTALGAAWLAGRAAGVWPDIDAYLAAWRAERRFTPTMAGDERARRYAAWRDAVSRLIRHEA
ncbi:MAG: glycerol kinase GlpK [Hyphomicrobiaceae bacterium]